MRFRSRRSLGDDLFLKENATLLSLVLRISLLKVVTSLQQEKCFEQQSLGGHDLYVADSGMWWSQAILVHHLSRLQSYIMGLEACVSLRWWFIFIISFLSLSLKIKRHANGKGLVEEEEGCVKIALKKCQEVLLCVIPLFLFIFLFILTPFVFTWVTHTLEQHIFHGSSKTKRGINGAKYILKRESRKERPFACPFLFTLHDDRREGIVHDIVHHTQNSLLFSPLFLPLDLPSSFWTRQCSV